MSVRRMHPDYQKLIGDPYMNCRILKIMQDSESAELAFWLDDYQFESRIYQQKGKDEVLVTFRESEKLLRKGSIDNLLISDFNAQVANPNLSVTLFSVQLAPESASRIEGVLKNLKSKLKVKKFSFTGNTSDALRILKHLDSESLKELSISAFDYSDLEDVEILNLGLENWKLESLTFGDLPNGRLPMEQWWDVPNTEMRLRYTELEDLKRLFQHFQKSETFSSCLLMTSFNHMELKSIFGKLDWRAIDGAFYYQFEGDKEQQLLSIHVYDNVLRFGKS